MTYIYVELPTDAAVILAAWDYVADNRHRHSWAGITALRACGTESFGANPIGVFSQRDREDYVKRKFLFEGIRWVKFTFKREEVEMAMEVAMRFGTGNMQYGNRCEPPWGQRYENKHRT